VPHRDYKCIIGSKPYQLVIKALGLFIKIINKKYTLPMKHMNILNINEKESRDEMKATTN
jgi:hypothetical protein